MASSSSFSVFLFLLMLSSCIAFLPSPSQAYNYPPIDNGLSFSYYKSTCPQVELLVRNYLTEAFKKNIGLAAALLRLHFHDCFVQGCDGSILLDGSAGGPSEKQAPPNLTLRPAAFNAINEIQALVTKACGSVVSCSDIAALSARDSVSWSGGPNYSVPLGRRDGVTFATMATVLQFLPSPDSNVSFLISSLAQLNLNTTDLVTLSGGHTIGIGHCTSFDSRLFPSQDPTLNPPFAKNLYLTCPVKNTTNTTVNDIRTPNLFDNKYYVDLQNREGLFTSDQGLFGDSRTKPIVTSFAGDQALFFRNFVYSMTKMGQLSVLTGNKGQIRRNCSAINPSSDSYHLATNIINDAADELSELLF